MKRVILVLGEQSRVRPNLALTRRERSEQSGAAPSCAATSWRGVSVLELDELDRSTIAHDESHQNPF
jgi:hypothetical protein